jgi:hypothetical protein
MSEEIEFALYFGDYTSLHEYIRELVKEEQKSDLETVE